MIWKCFNDEYPKSNCGLLIIIKNETMDSDFCDHIYYGYVFEKCDYIYIIFDITTCSQMAWKILKDHDKKDIYWFYDVAFSISNQPERLSEKTSKEDAIV